MLKSGYFFQKDGARTDDTMSLASIGQKLKSAREAQGLTLAQLFERTKIPVNHLQAVEDGNSDDLPEPVFIYGFIKRYSECVGLDGQTLSDEYRKHVEVAAGAARKSSAASAAPYYASSEYMSRAKVKAGAPTYKLWFFNGLIILGVIAAITWFINAQQSLIANQADPSLVSLRNATQRLAPVAPQPGDPAQSPEQSAQAPPPQNLSEKLTLSANKHVWVEVKRVGDDENLFTGYLEQGDRRDFEDSQGLRIRAGDGGSLSVERRGKIEPFGANGKVSERQFVVANAATAVGEKAATGAPAATGTAATVPSRPLRVSPRVRKSGSSESDSHSRQAETRRFDSAVREVPARYSEGRLDSD